MKRIMIWILGTITIVVLLLGYRTSTSSRPITGGDTVAPSPSPTPTPGTGGTAAPGATSRTVDGPVVATRWGPVQVRLTIVDNRITGVTLLQQPSGNSTDEQINAYAVPILVQRTIDAQSAKIDMVTGATVTSEGYVQSLQGAIDKAGI